MTRLRRLLLLIVLVSPIPLFGDAGILIPSGNDGPNPAILSLDQMDVPPGSLVPDPPPVGVPSLTSPRQAPDSTRCPSIE